MSDCGEMGKTNEHPQGFMSRLARSQKGNVMAIVAAAIIPLAALIGGGLDMGRAYMARARMQQACDAAALAGRRAMTTSSMTAANITEARKFFDFNFPQGTFQAATFTPVIRSKPGETTTVQVTASTTLPTTVMKIFGYQTLPLSVTCEARFDIGNTDIMLVLDTTGSMAYSISDGSGGTTTRLAALKQAVKDFYDALGAGSNSTGRIRYGFMPYSSTVNVGYQLPSSYLVGGISGETWDYQTRRLNTTYGTASNQTGNWVYTSGSVSASSNYSTTSGGTESQCVAPTSAAPVTNTPTTTTTTDAASVRTTTTVTTRTTNGYVYTATYTAAVAGGWQWQGWQLIYISPKASQCVITRRQYSNYVETKTDRSTQTPQYSWEYGKFPQTVSTYITGNAVANPAYNSNVPTDSDGNVVASTSTWAGCIEERDTDSSIASSTSTSSTPSNAQDLNIDAIPDPAQKGSKWRPHWPDVEFTRSNSSTGTWLNTSSRVSGGWNACPSQARRLTSYASRTTTPTGQSSSFDSYVNGLIAVGGTYHDIGMLWGARFLSPTGIFASDNANAPNGFNISRHIVFMTDGDMSAYQQVYGAYGFQQLDARVASGSTSDSGLTAIHNTRLQMLCNAIKAKGITIWVIGFRNQSEGDIQTPLQNCATSANHWTMAYTASALSQKFKDIAKNIGGLRVSQ
ncbi:pilus assembly protein TadG-related protein [Sphingobium naphthae]|uniref:Pilus assembly protein TadG-related protein n=1 Tax=Sphingobium naphthae TaxID=1886786 RepID=A0ABU3ZT92_9SPHN|nr:pilus assembly protein TadG-related protein [Sphingobium naphthae]MDV5822743.1 pilus assembly protein TadG-related protein [Sphingobium naphthae]